MSSNYKLPTTGNDFLSSVNEWEKSAIPGLTVFDMNCKPRQLLAETVLLTTGELVPNEIQISLNKLERIFDNEFKCPICLDTIESTSTVTACLHRFCSECIQKSLRMTVGPDKRHECPSCRAKLASRRASKPDTQFDELIQLLLKTQKSGAGAASSNNNSSNSKTPGNESISPRGAAATGTRTYKYDPVAAPASKRAGGGGSEKDKMDLAPYWDAHQNKVNEFKNKSIATRKDMLKKSNDSNKRAKTSHNGPTSASSNRTPSMTNGGAAGQGGAHGKAVGNHSHSGLPPAPGIDPSKVLFGLFPLPEVSNCACACTVAERLAGCFCMCTEHHTHTALIDIIHNSMLFLSG